MQWKLLLAFDSITSSCDTIAIYKCCQLRYEEGMDGRAAQQESTQYVGNFFST